jgi:hypothetical protein
MSGQSIVEEIKKLCFSRGASIGMDQHPEFIMNLEYLLRTHNYRVENEYHLPYSHRTLKTGRVQREHGIVDLLAYGWNHKIAIEYDSKISLKYKSIEKLLQSDADILIGIVGNGTLNHNKERILEVMNGSRITDRKVLLITMSDKAFEEVYWRT